MVDRIICYPGQIPTDAMFLNTNKNAMLGLGYLMQAVLGTNTAVDGLACTPTSPATLGVNVATGSIMSLAQVDATAYGSLGSDTADQVVKQGIVIGTTNFSTPAPATSGQSVVYLIQAKYQDTDGGSTVLPYYNASNPSMAYSGPGNTGVSQYTTRQGVCVLGIKTGVAAATGSQATPSTDAGFTGLYAITVANGQSTVTSGNIVQLATAPFISSKLAAIPSLIQSGSPTYAVDTSGSANTIAIALNPIPAALVAGQPIRVKVANTSTGAVVINVNGLGNVAVHDSAGNALQSGALQANGIYSFSYDGSYWQFQRNATRQVLAANTNFYVAATGSDSTGLGTSGSPWLTLTHAVATLISNYDGGGFNATINLGTGTFAGMNITEAFVGGNLVISGNGSSSTTISGGIATVGSGVNCSLQDLTLTNGGASGCQADQNSRLFIGAGISFGACSANHMAATNNGVIFVGGNYAISGSAAIHLGAGDGGTINFSPSVQATGTATVAFTAFAEAFLGGRIDAANFSYTGNAVTGQRYNANTLGIINTNGGGAAWFPGSTSGTNNGGPGSNGGIYV